MYSRSSCFHVAHLALFIVTLAGQVTATTGATRSMKTPSPQCPILPDVPLAYSNAKLPDPFTFFNGEKIVRHQDWGCRSREISHLLQLTQFGAIPLSPSNVTGTLEREVLTISVREATKSISFAVRIVLPSGDGPFPVLIGIGGSSLPPLPGVATIIFNNVDIADPSSRGSGKFYTLYGTNHTAGPIAAWVWGVSRIIDALQRVEHPQLQQAKYAVTGCSRNGKAAMAAGAFDGRIRLTLPQESGYGGASCWRIPPSRTGIPRPTTFPPDPHTYRQYFTADWASYDQAPHTQPVDHHLLASLIAPRGLLVIDHSQLEFLGPKSSWGCMNVAHKVWKAHGYPDNMGISSIGRHNHCQFPAGQVHELMAFVDKFLRDNDTDTKVIRNDDPGDFGFVEADYVDWETPAFV